MNQLLNLTQKKNEVQNKKQTIEKEIAKALDGDVCVSFENDSMFPKIYICDFGLLVDDQTRDNMKMIENIINHFHNKFFEDTLVDISEFNTTDSVDDTSSKMIQNIIKGPEFSIPKNLTLELTFNRMLTDDIVKVNGSPKSRINENMIEDGKQVFSGNYEYLLKFHNYELQQIIDKNLKITIKI